MRSPSSVDIPIGFPPLHDPAATSPALMGWTEARTEARTAAVLHGKARQSNIRGSLPAHMVTANGGEIVRIEETVDRPPAGTGTDGHD